LESAYKLLAEVLIRRDRLADSVGRLSVVAFRVDKIEVDVAVDGNASFGNDNRANGDIDKSATGSESDVTTLSVS